MQKALGAFSSAKSFQALRVWKVEQCPLPLSRCALSACPHMWPTELDQSGLFRLRAKRCAFRAYAFYGGMEVKGTLQDMPVSQFLFITFYTLSPMTMANMMAMPSVKGIASLLALVRILSLGDLQAVIVSGASLGASFAYCVCLGLDACMEATGAFMLDERALPPFVGLRINYDLSFDAVVRERRSNVATRMAQDQGLPRWRLHLDFSYHFSCPTMHHEVHLQNDDVVCERQALLNTEPTLNAICDTPHLLMVLDASWDIARMLRGALL